MKLPTVLFILLLALCAVVGVAFLIGETPFDDVPLAGGEVERVYAGHGAAHPRFPTMDHGGPGAARHEPILWVGWAFGMIQLAFIFGCLMLGLKPVGRARSWLAGCGIVLGFLFSMMVIAYQGSLSESAPSLFFSLPAPTAWFLYGFWPAQFLVVLLYTLVFSRAVVSDEDMIRFRAIVAGRRAGDR